MEPGTLGLAAALAAGGGLGYALFGRKPKPPTPTKLDQIKEAWPEHIAPAAGLAGSRLLNPAANEWGWEAGLQLSGGMTIEDAAPARRKLESALRTRRDAVRFEEDRDHADRIHLRVVQVDPHADPIPWQGPSGQPISHPIRLGLYETGEPARVVIAGRHVLIVGATGFGKSGLVNLLLGELAAAPDVVVCGVDFKGGVELKPWERCLHRLATSPEEARDLLQSAVEVIHARERRMAGASRKWVSSAEHPALVVVVEEQGEVADCPLSKELIRLEDTIVRTGRAMGVTLLTSLQRGTMDALGSDWIRQQSTVRICLRVEEDKEVDLVFGQGNRDTWPAHRLELPGKFLVRAQDQGLRVARPGRVFWVDDEMVRRTARRYAGRQPRLESPPSLKVVPPVPIQQEPSRPAPPSGRPRRSSM